MAKQPTLKKKLLQRITVNCKLLYVAFSALLLSACAWRPSKIEFIPTSHQSFSPKPADYDIQIFRSSVPDKPYIEIGIIHAMGAAGGNVVTGASDSYRSSMELLKKEARTRGADAIIDIREKSTPFVELTGTIIRWKN